MPTGEKVDLPLTPDGFAYSTMALQGSTLHVVYGANQYASLRYVQVRLE